MRIYSMTATFGKLEHETMTLQPGLNIIEAPNEWGKSTWCAFLVAMLYGIETRVHSTKTVIADKERYAPWSGSPMTGRMDLNWNGRDITIERRTKGRSIFGDFKAFETATGLPVPELTAANCGEQLLGVEKNVFTRAGFLRLSDLPVTQDEALRRRLNALVTTGDESGTADALAQKLKDLKNRCRLNRSTGLLSQAEAQQKECRDKLAELQELQSQSARIRDRQAQLETFHNQLLNHQAALDYAENRTYTEKLAAAEIAEQTAMQRLQGLQQRCAGLPGEAAANHTLAQLRRLRDNWNALHMEAQMQPPAPQPPEIPPHFRDLCQEDALRQAETDVSVYEDAAKTEKQRLTEILGILLAVAGIAMLLIPHWVGKAAGIAALLAGCLLWRAQAVARRRAAATAQALAQKYEPLPPEQWVTAALEYANAQQRYTQQLTAYQSDREELDSRIRSLKQQIHELTDGIPLSECEQKWESILSDQKALSEAHREYRRANELVQALRSAHKEVAPPQFPDTLNYSPADTARLLSDCTFEQRQLHQKLGNCQGRMDALGQESVLQQNLHAVTDRIARLEETYRALELAQNTLAKASAELQRRFAPRISRRAQALFGQLTGGRYTRLSLGEDLSIQAGAENEDTLYSALWRSEGTVDQLYLALRLAVAEELTPEAPLVLDDALVRFDDARLQQAMSILKAEAETRQVILFTCQSRENTLV